jgi:hypothetical protein
MNESTKNIGIKLLLTIPALLVGLLSAILFILKPLKDLWFPEQKVEEIPIVELPVSKHDFH